MARFEPTPANAPVPTPNPLGIFPPPPVPIIPKPRSYSSVAQTGLPTLQALQARQQAIQAPQMGEIRDPLQGASFLANTLVSNLTEGALMGQEQKQRQTLAQIMGDVAQGTGVPTADQVKLAMAIDPQGAGQELYKEALAARNREHWEPVPGTNLQRSSLTGKTEPLGDPSAIWKPSDIGGLRDDYTKAATIYSIANQTWPSMMEAANTALDPSSDAQGKGAADYNMIVGFAKLLDPNSVVREGEVSSASNLGGYIDTVQGWLNQWKTNGGKLDDNVRRAIMTQSQSRMNAYYNDAKQKRDWITSIAQKHNVDPNDVVPPMPELPKWEDISTPIPMPDDLTQLKPGRIYTDKSGQVAKFKGGDHNDPNNWVGVHGAPVAGGQ